MKKLSLWGSIASIFGLFLAFMSINATSVEQNVNGNQNNVIGENKGTININQGSNSPETKKEYVLRNPKAGSVLVISEPDPIAASTDSSRHVCMAMPGTVVSLTGEKANYAGIDMWRKVRITSGDCEGKIGWAALENISYE
ncbi:MAG: hypothetical protein VYA55_06970 [Pseudomonadota bacterium]|nr:hypothetical protein [Pseudomonadota bacterium]